MAKKILIGLQKPSDYNLYTRSMYNYFKTNNLEHFLFCYEKPKISLKILIKNLLTQV